jgi:hypothetical protein
VYDPFSFKQ